MSMNSPSFQAVISFSMYMLLKAVTGTSSEKCYFPMPKPKQNQPSKYLEPLHLVQLVHSNNMVPSLMIEEIPSFCTWTAVNSILIDTPATTPFFLIGVAT